MEFQMGEKVEVLIWTGFNANLHEAMFISYEDEDKVLVKVKGKHMSVDKKYVTSAGKPVFDSMCSLCGNKGKWVDQGNVGKWWYCTACKCEIVSKDNVPGISYKKTGWQTLKMPTFKFLNCKETTFCNVCQGVAAQYPDIDVKVGDEVECLVDTGTKLVKGKKYPVLGTTFEGVVIPVLNNKTGVFEEKNIRRCRLALCVP